MDENIRLHHEWTLGKQKGEDSLAASPCSADDYKELKSFVARITLDLQKNRSMTAAQWDRWFQEAYRLYVKHDVEGRNPPNDQAETSARSRKEK